MSRFDANDVRKITLAALLSLSLSAELLLLPLVVQHEHWEGQRATQGRLYLLAEGGRWSPVIPVPEAVTFRSSCSLRAIKAWWVEMHMRASLHTMHHEVGPGRCKSVDWLLNSSWDLYTKEKMVEGPWRSRSPKYSFQDIINALTWSNGFCTDSSWFTFDLHLVMRGPRLSKQFFLRSRTIENCHLPWSNFMVHSVNRP